MGCLHITNWYPNKYNPLETQFIKEHFDALQLHSSNELWHVQVRHDGGFFRLESGDYSEHEHYLFLHTPIQSWFVLERLHLFLLYVLKRKLRRRSFAAVNVHIAYPLLRFPEAVQKLFRKKIIITEHWSAYRLGFNLPAENPARKRIEQIFHHHMPVITVSRALMQDVVHFAGTDQFPHYIVPNIVDTNLFRPLPKSEKTSGIRFLMVASWATIKRPFLVLEALRELRSVAGNARLSIVGYGEQWEAMQAFVQEHKLGEIVHFAGRKTKEEIAAMLHDATVFLHPSEYETFSVVCAEALCSGVPVIASKVGGIPEVVPADAGLLVENNTESWVAAIRQVLEGRSPNTKEPAMIAAEAAAKYAKQAVGALYHSTLNKIIEAHA